MILTSSSCFQTQRQVLELLRCIEWHCTDFVGFCFVLLEFLQMMAAFQDILTNPGNMAKYKDDPDIAEAISKLTRKFGGGMSGGFNVPH